MFSKGVSESSQASEAIVKAVPANARRILLIGEETKAIEVALTGLNLAREVHSLSMEAPKVAALSGTIDCIVYHDALERMCHPAETLRAHADYLADGGCVICIVSNVQHYSIIGQLLRSELDYDAGGPVTTAHTRLYTYSTVAKVFLEAGFSPSMVGVITEACPAPFLESAVPLLRRVGVHPKRAQKHLSTRQYVIRAEPLAYYGHACDRDPGRQATADVEEPLTFVACVSNDATLRSYLLRSPCLGEGSPHELLLFRGCKSAAEGLNRGLAQARNRIVICLHQDVYLPPGWTRRFLQQYRLAESRFGKIGVAGVYGAPKEGPFAGYVFDADKLVKFGDAFPAQVHTLDELLLAVPRDTPARFEPSLGFHFYGADMCLTAARSGLTSVVVDALCLHGTQFYEFGRDFYQSARIFANKWSKVLPVCTPCAVVFVSWCGLPTLGREKARRLCRKVRRTLARISGRA